MIKKILKALLLLWGIYPFVLVVVCLIDVFFCGGHPSLVVAWLYPFYAYVASTLVGLIMLIPKRWRPPGKGLLAWTYIPLGDWDCYDHEENEFFALFRYIGPGLGPATVVYISAFIAYFFCALGMAVGPDSVERTDRISASLFR